MIFQQSAVDEWVEMSRICLGLLLKCSHHPNPEIVAMATAKLHTVLQVRATEDLHELSYLMFSINKSLNAAIEGMYYRKLNLEFLFNQMIFSDFLFICKTSWRY